MRGGAATQQARLFTRRTSLRRHDEPGSEFPRLSLSLPFFLWGGDGVAVCVGGEWRAFLPVGWVSFNASIAEERERCEMRCVGDKTGATSACPRWTQALRRRAGLRACADSVCVVVCAALGPVQEERQAQGQRPPPPHGAPSTSSLVPLHPHPPHPHSHPHTPTQAKCRRLPTSAPPPTTCLARRRSTARKTWKCEGG